MKDVNFIKPTGMDSLGRKFALVVFVAIVLAGFAIGYVVLMLQQNIALQQQQAMEAEPQGDFDAFVAAYQASILQV